MPETSDTDFTGAEFVRRNNNELVATWGNLVNRVLTMTHRNFDGACPSPARSMRDAERRSLERSGRHARRGRASSSSRCHFRAALGAAMAFAQEANRYLNETEPWKTPPDDRPAAARSLYTALCAINALKVALYPYLPFSARDAARDARLRDRRSQDDGWRLGGRTAGQQLREPAPLFKKLELGSRRAGRGAARDMTMRLFDTHTHIQRRRVRRDRDASSRARATPGSTACSSSASTSKRRSRRIALAGARRLSSPPPAATRTTRKDLTDADLDALEELAQRPARRRGRRDRPRLLPRSLAARRQIDVLATAARTGARRRSSRSPSTAATRTTTCCRILESLVAHDGRIAAGRPSARRDALLQRRRSTRATATSSSAS